MTLPHRHRQAEVVRVSCDVVSDDVVASVLGDEAEKQIDERLPVRLTCAWRGSAIEPGLALGAQARWLDVTVESVPREGEDVRVVRDTDLPSVTVTVREGTCQVEAGLYNAALTGEQVEHEAMKIARSVLSNVREVQATRPT
jgi:hypothetical protein